jgi:hypothetical protein
VAPNYGFADDPEGPCTVFYDPPGNSLIASIGDDMYGGSCFLVKREAFWSIGGFSEIRGVGFEDYEFHVRCNLQGLQWDVLPECIYRYRMPRAGNVSSSTPAYANHSRVLRSYAERLRASGLSQLPLAIASSYRKLHNAEFKNESLRKVLARRAAKPLSKCEDLNLLLLTCYFPFGMMSGWHHRAQALIRYFGSRYRLTLVTSMSREQLAPVRKEAFRHLKAVRGIEGSYKTAARADDLPFRVRKQYTNNLQSALQSLPTDQYHAALIDQIFMAECRRDLDTNLVLMEQNIESRLLRDTAARSWSEPVPEDYRDALEEARLLEHYENRAWPDFPLRSAVSELDRACIDSRARRGKTVTAANGADPSSWLPHARFEQATVLFSAHLGYLPNVDAAELLLTQIWPKVRKGKPDAKLILAGRDPSRAVQEAAARTPGVEVCANPKSMDKVAQRASITVAPLRLGSGTRCKILESMAWGLPVVSTTLGVEGIDAEDDVHLLVRDDPDEYAEAIVRLMSDELFWRRLRYAGAELVRARYSWDRVFEPLEDALIELVS